MSETVTTSPPEIPPLSQMAVLNLMRWNPYKAQWEVTGSVISWHKSWEVKTTV